MRKSKKGDNRPSWDEYFIEIVSDVSKRSTCLRRKVGAIVVLDKRILTTGYNGAAKGVEDCLKRGYCERERLNIPSGERHEKCRALHAEQNAIIQGAYHGVSLKGSTVYCTNSPCIICAKEIVNSGIIEVVYEIPYTDKEALAYLKEGKVKFRQFIPRKKK